MASARPRSSIRITSGRKLLEGANRPEIDQRQSNAQDCKQCESNFEIGVRHHRIGVLFQIEPLRVLKAVSVFMQISPDRICADDPPRVPLKM